MLLPCVNLTSADIRREPPPPTRLSGSAQIFDLYLFFCNFNTVLSPPSPPSPSSTAVKVSKSNLMCMVSASMYLQVTKGQRSGSRIRFRRSGSLLKVTARIRITKVTVWQTTKWQSLKC